MPAKTQDETGTDQNAEAAALESTPVDNGTVLQDAVDKATADLAAAQAAMVTAAASNDLKAMLAAGEAMSATARAVAKAQGALDNAQFELKATERMAFSVALKEKVEEFLATLDTAGALALGLTGIHVTIGVEGSDSPIVSITAKDKPKAAAAKTTTSGQARKANVLYQGTEYSAADFLTEFGGEAGAKAVDRARNYKDYGLAFSPGFDAAKKKLMKDLGATFVGE